MLFSGVAKAQASDRVLVLGRTLQSGYNSYEVQAITKLGLEPVIVDDVEWRAMSATDFRSYRAIVIADPGSGSTSYFQAATDTTDTWGPQVHGNTLILGT